MTGLGGGPARRRPPWPAQMPFEDGCKTNRFSLRASDFPQACNQKNPLHRPSRARAPGGGPRRTRPPRQRNLAGPVDISQTRIRVVPPCRRPLPPAVCLAHPGSQETSIDDQHSARSHARARPRPRNTGTVPTHVVREAFTCLSGSCLGDIVRKIPCFGIHPLALSWVLRSGDCSPVYRPQHGVYAVCPRTPQGLPASPFGQPRIRAWRGVGRHVGVG